MGMGQEIEFSFATQINENSIKIMALANKLIDLWTGEPLILLSD